MPMRRQSPRRCCLREIYAQLGWKVNSMDCLSCCVKRKISLARLFGIDLVEAPDIMQTIAVSCYGLGVACHLSGLHTLKIKETDRLVALENELSKLGASITIDEKSSSFSRRKKLSSQPSHRHLSRSSHGHGLCSTSTKVPCQSTMLGSK